MWGRKEVRYEENHCAAVGAFSDAGPGGLRQPEDGVRSGDGGLGPDSGRRQGQHRHHCGSPERLDRRRGGSCAGALRRHPEGGGGRYRRHPLPGCRRGRSLRSLHRQAAQHGGSRGQLPGSLSEESVRHVRRHRPGPESALFLADPGGPVPDFPRPGRLSRPL